MNILSEQEAGILVDYYSYLVGENSKEGKIKTVIRHEHELDSEKYKVIVAVKTNDIVFDNYIDLDTFCFNNGIPFPPPSAVVGM